jgi:hypothetical protein
VVEESIAAKLAEDKARAAKASNAVAKDVKALGSAIIKAGDVEASCTCKGKEEIIYIFSDDEG